MKSKKSSLRAALFLALIGAAFAFTACWQGTPVGGDKLPDVTENGGKTSDGNKSVDTQPNGNNAGGNNSGSSNVNTGGGAGGGSPGGTSGGSGSGGGNIVSSIEGITWESEAAGVTVTLRFNGGNVKATLTAAGQTVPDNGTYTVSGDTIRFTGFILVPSLNREFKYKVEGDTLTLLNGAMNTPVFTFKKA